MYSSTTIPAHWVLCDGENFNTTDKPLTL
ncbi:hypothetical protein ERD95_09220 [Enterobacteriaceae bacterium ML5]|nr:hypothetical protein ERD95_09220 [Enterobacteriaceae bacterium ML5]